MTKSKFVYESEINNKLILFHLLTFNIVVLNLDNSDYWKAGTYNNIDKELLNNLIDLGFIILDDTQDILIIKRLKNLSSKAKEESSHTIFITNDCNMRCPYCFENRGNIPDGNTMDRNMVDACLKYIQMITPANHLTRILVFGGEPLLNCNKEIIDYLMSKLEQIRFKHIEIVTNGIFVDNYLYLLKRYQKSIASIRLTLNGNKDEHNIIRDDKNNINTYDTIINSIGNILDCGINVNVNLLLEKRNINHMSEVISKLNEISYNHKTAKMNFSFGRIQFRTSPHKINYKYEIPVNKYYFELIVDSLNNKYPLSALAGGEFPILLDIYKGIIESDYENILAPNIKPCRAVYPGRYCYYPDGFIYPCTDVSGIKDCAIGCFYPEPTHISNNMWTNYNLEGMPCSNCKFIAVCGGGCPVSNMFVNGDINQPYCNDVDNTIEQFLKAIYITGALKYEECIY